MKNLIAAAVLFSATLLIASCAKPDTSSDKPKETQVLGKWDVQRMQLRIYYGGVFYKDTIIKQNVRPRNYVNFDAAGNFEYLFNTSAADVGTYQFKGTDSLISTVNTKTYRWKMLTLTNVLFTVMNTSTNDPAFPGAKVEYYQTFVR